jgi:hypothetical protein
MKRRGELTFAHNRAIGRHGWLRLTPAYSVRLVDEVLGSLGPDARRVLEPFCGTGTTPLSAAERGLEAVAVDINPFLVWLARAKTARYSEAELAAARARIEAASAAILDEAATAAPAPPITSIERWWSEPVLAALRRLRAAFDLEPPGGARDLLDVIFCRTMITTSNAAFHHPSMSFRGEAKRPSHAAMRAQLEADAALVLGSAAQAPPGAATVVRGDSIALDASLRSAIDGPPSSMTFDVLVTSPPYPNRMSYVRELRPYMYWMGHLRAPRDAGELDWAAIGGTWGVATSRLSRWTPTGAPMPRGLLSAARRIQRSGEKNAALMSQYVLKYFDDMGRHFVDAAKLMRVGGSVHYVVGNAAFYGALVPTERFFCEQLRMVGFSRAESKPLRKRNSKRELFEFEVRAVR